MGFVRSLGRSIDDAVHSVGSAIDDTVNDAIPGGWLTVGAIATGGALGAFDGLGAAAGAGEWGLTAEELAAATSAAEGAGAAGTMGGFETLGDLGFNADALAAADAADTLGGEYLSNIAEGSNAGTMTADGWKTWAEIDQMAGVPAGTEYLGTDAAGTGLTAKDALNTAKNVKSAIGTAKSVTGSGSGLTGAGALLGGAGTAALLAAMQSDSSKFGVPEAKKYVSTFNPSKYKVNAPNPNMFKPQPGTANTVADQIAGLTPLLYAEGGSIKNKNKKPVYTPHAKLAVMNPWDRAAAEYENQAYKAQMPVGTTPAPTGPSLGQLNLAHGGQLGGYSDGGRMLRGPGDGMSDSIPANISGKQPARLADGEFVVPADVVSHLGNGSTDAGARELYKMLDRVRQARTGRKSQGKQIKPHKFMPV